MGDRAGFVARPKKGVSATELMMQIEEYGGRDMAAFNDIGIVVGKIKSTCPGCCMISLLHCDKIDRFASLSETSNKESDDYCSWETGE